MSKSSKIIIDAYPSQFIFIRPAKDFRVSIHTFLYMTRMGDTWVPISIGKEVQMEKIPADPNVCRIDLFDLDRPIPPGIFNKQNPISIFIEYGIGKCFEKSILLPLNRPVVYFLGTVRFKDQFENPRETFQKAFKTARTGRVIFDQADL